MLEVKTEEQQKQVEKILDDTSIWFAEDGNSGLYIDDWISYDEMASIVDYLREQNKLN